MKKKLIISAIIIMLSFIIWWTNCVFFVPHFQAGPNNTLVSKNTKLELVTDSEPEKLGIHVPNFLPFWKTIGEVDGDMDGTLWEFTDKGNNYILYTANTEMPWQYIYKYSTN
ncbi:hypothetical protein [Niallia sp. 03133]|uniref:hypothetical protein n=1 Tax=Niallia sp. 03133 TaxID=3458060 RepID=UPI0040440A66